MTLPGDERKPKANRKLEGITITTILVQTIFINHETLNSDICFSIQKLLASSLLINLIRHLPSDDVIFGIAVKLATRLFDTVKCLTEDKAERNSMCKRLCNQYKGDPSQYIQTGCVC